MNDTDRINALEQRLDDLTSRLSHAEHELNYKIDDARSDAERAVTDVRNDLSTLEHKVDYS